MNDLRLSLDSKLQPLFEAAPDATVCVDASGRITLVNSQAELLFGYPRSEMEGQPVEMLVVDAARAAHVQLRAGYMAHPVSRPMYARMGLAGRRRDGTVFPADISLSAMETAEGTRVLAAVRDATERKRGQRNLDRAVQSLTSVANSVAHDLRTPLRALAGYSAVLLEEYGDALGDAGRGYAERIGAASVQMGKVMDGLQYLVRLSQAEVRPESVDLGAEAARIAEDLQHADPDRRVRFAIQRPTRAMADPLLIRSVLRCLLDNAWKFTSGRDDGMIEFGTAAAGDARSCFYVRDNGAGFDPAYAGKLFTPFQRLHTPAEFPGIGTGIGLASVRLIVEAHGGQAWAEGAIGEGTTVYCTLHAGGIA